MHSLQDLGAQQARAIADRGALAPSVGVLQEFSAALARGLEGLHLVTSWRARVQVAPSRWERRWRAPTCRATGG